MPVHLVLRLQAPFASAGTIAGEETRPTADTPTRSMVLGLLGNALGLDRTCAADMHRLDRLQAGTWFSALVLSEPGRWIDIQNNRTPSDRLRVVHESPHELPQSGDIAARLERGGRISDHPLAYGIGPVESVVRIRKLLHEAPRQREKHYLTGLRALAAFSPMEEGWPEPPTDLAAALRNPARALWIGRKSCPPSAPVWLQEPVIEAANGPEALLQAAVAEMGAERLMPDQDRIADRAILWWEADPQPGGKAADQLGISGGFATIVIDRRDWVRGLHNAQSTMWRGTAPISGSRHDA